VKKAARRVLTLSRDKQLDELIVRMLSPHDAVLVTSAQVMVDRLLHEHFDLVLVTNFGTRFLDALELLPARRSCPAMFLTGHISPELETLCELKHVSIVRVPAEPGDLLREFRIALDDISVGRR
jgi:hypothetical protein